MEPEVIAIYLCVICGACAKMTFYGHPGVVDFYMKIRSDSEGGKDFFTGIHRYRRKSLCDALLSANLFSLSNGPLVPDRDPRPDTRYKRNIQAADPFMMGLSENVLGHGPYYVLTGSEIIPVGAFPCILTSRAIVLLTYGFDQFHKRMFVLSGMQGAVNPLHMIGVLEANPLLDRSHQYVNFRISRSIGADSGASTSSNDPPKISNPNLLSSTMGPPPVPTNLDLRLRSEFQHFRVCSSVANQIGKDPKFELDMKVYNYVHSMVEVHEVAKAIGDERGNFRNYTHVLPCAINRSWDKPQFYLLRDRFDRTSVFLFLASKDEIHGEILRVEGVVNEVVALSDT